MDALHAAAPALALSVVALALSAGRRGPAGLLPALSSACLFAFAALLLYNYSVVDWVSLVLSVTSFALVVVVTLYTTYYVEAERLPRSLPLLVSLFGFSISLTYLAVNLILFVIAWSFMEIIGFVLVRIGEEYSTEGSLRAARGYLLTSTTAFEITAFTLIVLSVPSIVSSYSPNALYQPFAGATPVVEVSSPVLLALLLAGFVAKAALFPLHFWLPGAHSTAPSPASALLSGLTTPLGFYGLLRLSEIVDLTAWSQSLAYLLLAMGLSSIAYAGLEALGQRDGKIMLAYTTILTNGFTALLFALYLSSPISTLLLVAVVLVMLMQMGYKTVLFCGMGLIELAYGTRYIQGLAGVSQQLRTSSPGVLIAVYTLIGVPGTVGFLAKLLSMYLLLSGVVEGGGPPAVAALAGAALYIALSAVVGVRVLSVYTASMRSRRPPLEFKQPNTPLEAAVLAMGLLSLAPSALLLQGLGGPGWLAALAVSTLPIPLLVSLLQTARVVTGVARAPA
ncbi:complex I subunit 5 family protein [Thermogladius sp. KZ2Tp1]|uniref:proton-conducting transporter transmembrane domain-containing protein n=1 Tax=Thermogladius sp. KZ2Tp1 TaxID=3136289 RepID=UPI003DA99083